MTKDIIFRAPVLTIQIAECSATFEHVPALITKQFLMHDMLIQILVTTSNCVYYVFIAPRQNVVDPSLGLGLENDSLVGL